MKTGGIIPLQKLARFKLELAEAVKKENYEEAARLRDRILALQEQCCEDRNQPHRRLSHPIKYTHE